MARIIWSTFGVVPGFIENHFVNTIYDNISNNKDIKS